MEFSNGLDFPDNFLALFGYKRRKQKMKTLEIMGTKANSEHYRALNIMRRHKKGWFTAQSIARTYGFTMSENSLGRRLREDENKGLICKMKRGNHMEYQWINYK